MAGKETALRYESLEWKAMGSPCAIQVYGATEGECEVGLTIARSEVARLEETWSEDFVDWLNGMREVLFVIGFILLLIEMKTPGFALPGILGVIMFGLA